MLLPESATPTTPLGPKYDPASRHAETLRLMAEGSLRTNAEIIADLNRAHLSIEALIQLLCEFVTRRPLWRMMGVVSANSAIQRFLDGSAPEARTGFVRDLVIRPNSAFHMQVIELFEADFGDIREAFRYLADQRHSYGVCYFDKFVASVARIANRIDWLADPRTMFDGSFLQKVKELQLSGTRLEELSGLTNTRLAAYEWAFADSAARANGFADVRTGQFDACIDLGGGFTTKYLATRFAQPLECFDLHDPALRASHERGFVLEQHRAYGLDDPFTGVVFRPFNVLTDEFSARAQSYLITSFGFMGSTPGVIDADGIPAPQAQPFLTNFYSIYRVCQLIDLGKHVTLCVFARPTKVRFANICYTLRFEARRCVSARSLYQNFYSDGFYKKVKAGQWRSVFQTFAFPPVN